MGDGVFRGVRAKELAWKQTNKGRYDSILSSR
jgi:hypothetical protein